MTENLETSTRSAAQPLPEILQSRMRVVFCVSSASKADQEESAYFATRSNKFWKTLHEIRLTPLEIKPGDYAALSLYGLGLIDLARYRNAAGEFDAERFRNKIAVYAPKALCFNGKNAARMYLQVKQSHPVDYGELGQLGDTRLYVAPSTSAGASRYWDAAYWQTLVS